VIAYLALNTRPERGVRALLVHTQRRPMHTASSAGKVAA